MGADGTREAALTLYEPTGRFDRATGLWLLTERWYMPLGDGWHLECDPGILSDGASIPRPLQPFVGPRYCPHTFAPAFGHDVLYWSQWRTRRQADSIFYDHLREYGVSRAKAGAYWSAVRAAGWWPWRRHTSESITEARSLCRPVQMPTLVSVEGWADEYQPGNPGATKGMT